MPIISKNQIRDDLELAFNDAIKHWENVLKGLKKGSFCKFCVIAEEKRGISNACDWCGEYAPEVKDLCHNFILNFEIKSCKFKLSQC